MVGHRGVGGGGIAAVRVFHGVELVYAGEAIQPPICVYGHAILAGFEGTPVGARCGRAERLMAAAPSWSVVRACPVVGLPGLRSGARPHEPHAELYSVTQFSSYCALARGSNEGRGTSGPYTQGRWPK